MIKLFLKRKYLLILLILVPIIFCLPFIYRQITDTTHIFEIKNTQNIYYTYDTKITSIEKRYMIIKPPKDLKELKVLVEKFIKENPVNMKMVEDDVLKNSNVTADKIIKKDVYIYFYRESSELPRNWQPDDSYMSEDHIEHHTNDCIAAVVWSDLDQHKSYSIMRKNKKGDGLEEIVYIDDKVESHEFGE